MTWTPFPATTLRSAVFRTLTKTLISDQTVEPTQVAGFNQFFDDAEGAEAWRYGIGIDQKLPGWDEVQLYVGGEFSKRDLEVPGFIPFPEPTTISEDFDEELGRAYFHLTPHRWWALSFEYQFERFIRDLSFTGPEDFTELTTQRLMLEPRFFHPSGFRASLKATYANQAGEFGDFFGDIVPGEDAFWVVDLSIGYRLPKRFGLITLVGKNVFDEKFRFQDTDPGNPRIFSERLMLVKFNLFF